MLVQDHQVSAAVGDGLRGGCLRLLVPDLAVNDGGIAAFGIAADVLPHVEDRSARRVDQRAALTLELLEHCHGDAERRQDHDVARPETLNHAGVVGEKADPHRAELVVDVRVVNDFAGQEHCALGEALAGLIGVVDGAIDAVAEAELARQVQRQPAGAEHEIMAFDLFDERAVIIVGEHAGHGMLQIEALAKNQG